MTWNLLRYEANAFRGKSTVVPFASKSRVRAWKGVNSSERDSSDRPVFSRLPDWPEMAVWMSYLRRGDCFVDVGANVGLYSLLALEQGCEVVAIEPAPDMAVRFLDNLELNRIDPSLVSLLQVAALDRKCVVSLRGPDASRRFVSTDRGEIPADRLDDLIAGRHVHGMKIDVEGFERLVVEGAGSLLAQDSLQLVQLEWNHCSEINMGESREALASRLREEGFTLMRMATVGRPQFFESSVTPEYGRDVFAARGAALSLIMDWSDS